MSGRFQKGIVVVVSPLKRFNDHSHPCSKIREKSFISFFTGTARAVPVKIYSKNFAFRVWKWSKRAFLLAKNKKIMLVRFLTEQILYFLPQLQPKSTFLEKKSRLQKSTAGHCPVSARAVVFDIWESTARAVPGQLILEDEKKRTTFNFSFKNSLKMLFFKL